jgi:hypothetical protein
MVTLEFFDQYGKSVGRVSEVDGKLEATTRQTTNLLAAARRNGVSDEDFITKFNGYSNGYLSAQIIPE